MNKEIIIEALKELGRVVVLAILPLIIASLEAGVVDWRLIGVTGAVALLRAIDKYLHLKAPEGTSGGLTRF